MKTEFDPFLILLVAVVVLIACRSCQKRDVPIDVGCYRECLDEKSDSEIPFRNDQSRATSIDIP